jgi:hypothetical protein
VLGVGEGELGTELSLLPKNRSGSGEVDSAGTFLPIFFTLEKKLATQILLEASSKYLSAVVYFWNPPNIGDHKTFKDNGFCPEMYGSHLVDSVPVQRCFIGSRIFPKLDFLRIFSIYN